MGGTCDVRFGAPQNVRACAFRFNGDGHVTFREDTGKAVPIKHYAKKAYGGVDVKIHVFWISALDAGDWTASRSGLITPGERAPRYPLDRKLGGPQSRSGQCGEEKILDPIGTRTPTPRSSSS
jgi:hypothetical protein